MPAALDACLERVLADWKTHPEKAPKKDKGGKPLDTPEKRRSVAYAICTKSLQRAGKMSYDDEAFYLADEVEFEKPVWTGFAFTNKPHIMGLDKMSFVDREGKPWTEESGEERLLKVPLLILGKWRHRMGILNFTKEFVKRLEENFRAGLAGQDIPGDAKHKDIVGSVAWATGKFIFETNARGQEQWSAIVEPTEPGADLVEKKIFKYGSIEFHPKFKSRMEPAALSADGIVAAWDADCIVCQEIDWTEFYKEGDMPEGTDTQGNDQDQEAPQVVELSEFEAVKAQLAKAQTDLARQTEEAVRYRSQAWDQSVKRVLLEAENRKDDQGRALPTVFLEFLRDTLHMEEFEFAVGDDKQVIKLEADSQDVQAIHRYYRSRIVQLARDLPGYVPMETLDHSDPDKKRPVQMGQEEQSELNLTEEDQDLMWQGA